MINVRYLNFNLKCFLILIGLLLTLSCEEDKPDLITYFEDSISGDWQWKSSTYYNTSSGEPYILNPDSLGLDIIYNYSPDGSLKIYKNNQLREQGRYWFESTIELSSHVSQVRLFIEKDEYISSVPVTIYSDSLILINEPESDNVTKVFIRKP